jgi:AraC-like DNA-binding protein
LELGFRLCRSVLIEPNQLHLLQTSTADHVFIYIDALSQDLAILRSRCRQPGETLSFDLDNEHDLIDLLAHMPRDAQSWLGIEAALGKSLGLIQRQNEMRIAPVVQALLLFPDDPRPAEEWARSIGLSSSRFQHYFKECVGIPFRRFRLWARVRIALKCAMQGSNLTQAAMQSGFSSSAHMSAAFKAMFGISLSQLISTMPLYLEGDPFETES